MEVEATPPAPPEGGEEVHSNLPLPREGQSLRREWGFAPLCGAGAAFSGSSEDPSRPNSLARTRALCIFFPKKTVKPSPLHDNELSERWLIG